MINSDVSAQSILRSPPDSALPLQRQRLPAEICCKISPDQVLEPPRTIVSQSSYFREHWRTSSACRSRLSSGATRGWSRSGASAAVSYSRVGYNGDDVCESPWNLSIIYDTRPIVFGSSRRDQSIFEVIGPLHGAFDAWNQPSGTFAAGADTCRTLRDLTTSLFLLGCTSVALQVYCGWRDEAQILPPCLGGFLRFLESRGSLVLFKV